MLWKRKKKSVCLRLQNAIPHYFVLRQHFLPICPQPTSQVIILFYYCRANKVKPNVINWEHIQFQNSKLEGINQSSSSFQTLIISLNILCKIHLIFFLRFYLFIFREGKGGERGTSMCGYLSHAPQLGTWPATQACALTGNRTNDPLLRRPALNPLSHSSQGVLEFL